MSFSNPGEDPPLLLPIPADALLLPAVTSTAGRTPWLLALSALRRDLAQRGLDLPLEAAASREGGSGVVTLNGFRVQVVWAGLWADSLAIPTSGWRQADAAPQFVLASGIEIDEGVVRFAGVLTSEELVAAVDQANPTDGLIHLPVTRFKGGLDRLLTLVQLLEPGALSPLAPAARPGGSEGAVAVLDWLSGRIADVLGNLGAELVPASAAAFRSPAPAPNGNVSPALAILRIPLGIVAGELRWGDDRKGTIEPFQLELIACGESRPERLRVRVVPQLSGDLLPDHLRLIVGSKVIVSTSCNGLELEVRGGDAPIRIRVEMAAGTGLALPPLLMPLLVEPESGAGGS